MAPMTPTPSTPFMPPSVTAPILGCGSCMSDGLPELRDIASKVIPTWAKILLGVAIFGGVFGLLVAVTKR